mmetsp:Transcript_7163/g.20727  ORF Transcript_7163/g.20727 Transcript_7163/m.20727 type:complete len:126 (-) Transcript_7163:358-735(-)
MLTVYLLYYIGLLPFVPLRCDVFGFPSNAVDANRIQRELPGAPRWLCKFIEATVGGNPPRGFLCPALCNHLRRRGIAIHLLGAETPQALQVAVSCGVTAVLTDHPEWLVKRLEEKNDFEGMASVV